MRPDEATGKNEAYSYQARGSTIGRVVAPVREVD